MKTTFNINNCEIEIKEISNYLVFNVELSDEFTNLQVPQFYIEEQDRWVENLDHPDYYEALKIKNIEKQEKGFLSLLEHAIINIQTNREIIGKWNKLYKSLSRNELIKDEIDNYSENILMAKYFIFNTIDLKSDLVKFCLLCEENIFKQMYIFSVTRNNESIFKHNLRFSIDTKIDWDQLILFGQQIVHPFDEYKCCIESNLNWNNWLNNEYTKSLKETTIALWRMNKIISSHQEDAIAIENEKKSKK